MLLSQITFLSGTIRLRTRDLYEMPTNDEAEGKRGFQVLLPKQNQFR